MNTTDRRIRLEIGSNAYTARLNDTATADAIWEALPIETSFSTWGDEIYFDTGIELDPEETQETLALGDVGYWPPGRAMCLFYGATPVSGPGEIRPASAVAVFGRLEGDPAALREVKGLRIRVTRA